MFFDNWSVIHPPELLSAWGLNEYVKCVVVASRGHNNTEGALLVQGLTQIFAVRYSMHLTCKSGQDLYLQETEFITLFRMRRSDCMGDARRLLKESMIITNDV